MTDHAAEAGVSRRALVVDACLVGGVVTLGGCSVYDTSVDAPTADKPAAPGASIAATADKPAAPGASIAATADVPVGGGLVVKDQKVVVTQPTNGDFKGFSAVCTHAGCVVRDVVDGTINCPCHGSKFSIEDGSVVAGPAKKPLPEVTVAVAGREIVSA